MTETPRWPLVALKRLAVVMPSNVDKHSVEGEAAVRLCNYVDVYRNDCIREDMDFMVATASDAQIERFTLRAHDVIVTKDSEERSDIGIPSFVSQNMPGVVCGYHLAVFRPNQRKLHGGYLAWALRCRRVQAYYETAATGISRYALSVNDLGMTPISLPSFSEQERIANFLEQQTARIDTLIAEKQKLLELLTEYSSSVLGEMFSCGCSPGVALTKTGIEWLPTVPVTWQLTKFMAVSSVVRGGSPRPAGDPRFFNGDQIPWVTVAEITKDENIYLTETATRLTAEGEQFSRRFAAGTLLLSNSGATLGVPKILAIDACANDGVVGFERLSSKVRPLFAYYYLRSLTASLRDRIRQGAGQPNLNTTIVKSLPLPLPPLPEQDAIIKLVRALDERSQGLSRHVEEHIERLREYRSSLISATVTGQMDISTFKPPAHSEKAAQELAA